MKKNVYEVRINGKKVDTMLITNKDLSCIDIVKLLEGIVEVKTYCHYKDNCNNNLYRINDNNDIVSFNMLDNGYVELAEYTQEQKDALINLSNAIEKVSILAEEDETFERDIINSKLGNIWGKSLDDMIFAIRSVVEDM